MKVKGTRSVSTLVIMNKQGQVLMQDREGIRKFGEDWAFFGGGIEEGETPEQGIEREIMEELGMKDFEYIKIYEGTHINRTAEIMINRNVYLHFTDKKQEDFTVYEGAGAKYFYLDELKDLKLPGTLDTYKDCFDTIEVEYKKHYEKNI